MKKRFLFVSFLLLLMTGLSSCGGFSDNAGGGLDLNNVGVDGITDEIVDTNANSIKFSVPFEVKSFLVSQINAGSGIEVRAEDKNGSSLGNELSLSVGENVFTIVFRAGKTSAAWKLIITREAEKAEVKKIQAIKAIPNKVMYEINEKFTGGMLEVTYTDGTKENVPLLKDTLIGFDTSSSGTKVVSVSYKGKTTTFEITVAEGKPNPDPTELSSIALKSYTKDYNLNESFKGATITLNYIDGRKENLDVDSSMLIGFDTSKAGSFNVTISYKGKTTILPIIVHEEKVIITYALKDVVTSYTVGDIFSGSIVKKTNDVEEIIEITPQMITGFDSTKAGNQAVEIIYESFKKTINVTIAEALLTEDDVLDFMASIEAVGSLEPGNTNLKEEYKNNYNKCLKWIKGSGYAKELYPFFKSIDLKKGQILATKNIIENDILVFMDYLFQFDFNQGSTVAFEILGGLDYEMISQAQAALSKAASIFTSNQLGAFMLDNLHNSNDYDREYDIYNETMKKFVKVSLDEVLHILNNDDFTAYIKARGEILSFPSQDRMIEFFDCVKAIAMKVSEIPTNDLLSITQVFTRKLVVANEIDNIHTAGRIIKEITDLPECIRLSDIIFELTNITPNYNLEHAYEYQNLKSTISFILEKMPVIASYLEEVDVDLLKSIDSILDSMNNETEPDMKAIVNIAKGICDLYNSVCKTDSDNENMALAIETMFGIDGAILPELILKLSMVANLKIDANGPTEEQMNTINDFMMFIDESMNQRYELYMSSYSDAIIKKNSTIDDFVKEINYAYRCSFRGENIEITSANLNLDEIKRDLKLKGIHKGTVTVNEISTSFVYYVYDETSEIILEERYPLTEYVIYVDKNGTPLGAISNGGSYLISFEDLMAKDYLNMYFKDDHFRASIGYEEFNAVFEIITPDKPGINLTLVKATTKYGVAYLPANVCVIDEKNNVITDYLNSKTNNKIVFLNDTINKIIVIYNYGYSREEIFSFEPLLDTSKPGKTYYDFNGTMLEFEVMSEYDYRIPTSISSIRPICLEELQDSISNKNLKLYFSSLAGDSFEYNLEEFTELFKLNHDDKVTLDIKILSTGDGEANVELTVLRNGVAIKKYQTKSYIVSQENYNSFNVIFFDRDASTILEDNEYNEFIKLSREEMINQAHVYLNSLKGVINGYKFDENKMYTNILDLYDQHNIPYHIELDSSNGYYNFNLVVNEMVVTSYAVISRSFNNENIMGIDLQRNKYDRIIFNSNMINDEEYLYSIIKNNCTGTVRTPFSKEEISGDELINELKRLGYKLNSEYSYNRLRIKLSYNDNYSDISFDAIASSEIEIKISLETNPLLIAENMTQAQLDYLVKNNIIRINVNISNLEFDEIKLLSVNEAEGYFTIMVSFIGEAREFNINYKLVTLDMDRISFSLPRVIAFNDFNNLTDDEIFAGMNVLYDGHFIYTDSLKLLKDNKAEILNKKLFENNMLTFNIKIGDKTWEYKAKAVKIEDVDKYVDQAYLTFENTYSYRNKLYYRGSSIDEFLSSLYSVEIYNNHNNKSYYHEDALKMYNTLDYKLTKIDNINGYEAYDLYSRYSLNDNHYTVIITNGENLFLDSNVSYDSSSRLVDLSVENVCQKVRRIDLRYLDNNKELRTYEEIYAILKNGRFVEDNNKVEFIVDEYNIRLEFVKLDTSLYEARTIDKVLSGLNGDRCKVTGRVIGISYDRCFIIDSTGILMLYYDKYSSGFEVNDTIDFYGSIRTGNNSEVVLYPDAMEASKVAIEVEPKLMEFKGVDFDNYSKNYPTDKLIKYIRFTGIIDINGTFVNIIINDGHDSRIIPSINGYGDNLPYLEGYNGLEATFTGFLAFAAGGHKEYPNVYLEDVVINATDEEKFNTYCNNLEAKLPKHALRNHMEIRLDTRDVKIRFNSDIDGVMFSNDTIFFKPYTKEGGTITINLSYKGFNRTISQKVQFLTEEPDLVIDEGKFWNLPEEIQNDLAQGGEILAGNGVKLKFDNNGVTHPTWFDGKFIRFYYNTKMSIISDKPIKRIDFYIDGDRYTLTNDTTVSNGTIDGVTNSWCGGSTNIEFLAGSQVRFYRIDIFFA